MSQMIAYCGLDCFECEAYLATQANDNKQRKQVAKNWSEAFGVNIKAENINCDGCKSTSDKLFSHCKVCKIRSCALGKNYETCAECTDYPCDDVHFIIDHSETAKERLEKLKNN